MIQIDENTKLFDPYNNIGDYFSLYSFFPFERNIVDVEYEDVTEEENQKEKEELKQLMWKDTGIRTTSNGLKFYCGIDLSNYT
ncbi:MAG: hypothetical protein ACOC2U_00025 [bacterium]